MISKRTYDDGCGTAHALDLVGERWALLVIRELLLGPKRFTDLRAGLPGVSANVLAQRLRELEHSGVVRRHRLAPPAGSWVYELTEWGKELDPIVTALGIWALRSAAMPRDAPIGVDSTLLSLRRRFDPRAAGDLGARYELRVGEHRFRVAVADGGIAIARGGAAEPDAVVETDPRTLFALISGDIALDDVLRAGTATIAGSRPAVERLLAACTPADAPMHGADGRRDLPSAAPAPAAPALPGMKDSGPA